METLRIREDDFYLGDWFVQPRRHQLAKDGQEQRLEPRFMRVLQCLAAQPGEVIERQALMETVWEGVYVESSSVSQAISHLRKVLGDNPKQPIFIETIPKRGYRLLALVRAVPSPTPLPIPDDQYIIRQHRALRFPQQQSWVAGGALIICLILLGWHRIGDTASVSKPLHAVPVTSYPGLELDPALSPDGTQLAFAGRAPEAQRFNLYIKTLDAELPLQLTHTEADDVKPTWSPDGRQLAFTRLQEGTCKVMLLPVPGGPARELIPCGIESQPTLAWSPDGSALILADRPQKAQPYQLVQVDVDTREKTVLTTPPSTAIGDRYAVFSPNRQHIAFIRTAATGIQEVHAYAIKTKVVKALTRDAAKIRGLAWKSDGALVFSSSRSGGFSLWSLSFADGRMQWLGSEQNAFYPTAAQQSHEMVYARMSGTVNLWRVPFSEKDEEIPSIKLSASSASEWHPQISPNGKHIAFISDRSGYAEVWVSSADGSTPRQLTRLQGDAPKHPKWAPDGQQLAFQVQTGPTAQLYTINIRGGAWTTLTTDTSSYGVPTWSRDGKAVYASSNRRGRWEMWRIPATGGTSVPLGFDGVMAQEGEAGAFYYTRADSAGLWHFDPSTKREAKIHCNLASEDALNWEVREEGVYFVSRYAQAVVLWAFDSGNEQQVALLPHRLARGASFSIAPREDWLLFARADRQESDIMLIAAAHP